MEQQRNSADNKKKRFIHYVLTKEIKKNLGNFINYGSKRAKLEANENNNLNLLGALERTAN